MVKIPRKDWFASHLYWHKRLFFLPRLVYSNKLQIINPGQTKSFTYLIRYICDFIKISSPKKWIGKDGNPTFVNTPYTLRARELRDLYHALLLDIVDVDERLQILLSIKCSVKEFDCNLSRDIVLLVDREGDLLSRGRSSKSIEGTLYNNKLGLRVRISGLFLQFIQTPEFNPAVNPKCVSNELKLGRNTTEKVYYCRGCTCYKPSIDFYMSTTIKKLGKCKDCDREMNAAIERRTETIFEEMLTHVKHEESKSITNVTTNGYISKLQASELRYIVDIIWRGKSAIGGSDKLSDLILTRWNINEEISPWNCILLTVSESVAHIRLLKESSAGLDSVYSDEFRAKVHQKHMFARQKV